MYMYICIYVCIYVFKHFLPRFKQSLHTNLFDIDLQPKAETFYKVARKSTETASATVSAL